MPYASTIAVSDVFYNHRGRRCKLVTITETLARDTSETTVIAGLFTHGRIHRYKSTLTAGTGTTIDPEIGRAATWTDLTQNEVWQNGTAAAHIDLEVGVDYYSATGSLYLRSGVNNATADHTVVSEFMVMEGWGA